MSATAAGRSRTNLPPPQRLSQSQFAALAAVVGDTHVLADPGTRERYSRSTAARATEPLAVLRPGSHEEVVALMQVAAALGLAVHPLSSGRNWGYGDACAVTPGQLIVDLGRMNRILRVDPELAYAVIEPGVTQRQLSEHLRAHGYRLWMDCTGAGPDTSLMGNILERGFGHSPYGNRLQHVSGMQVVLANGEVLHTGFGHYPDAKATHLFPYGLGPFLDGMFTQSNLGIVTRIGMWLMPMAGCVNHFLCAVPRHADLGAVIDALRPLKLDGTLRSVLHIGNDLRVLSGGGVFPRGRAPGQSRLPEVLRAELGRAAGTGAWTVSGALYGSPAQVAAARAALRLALKGMPVKASFLSEGTLRLGAVAARLLGNSGAGQRLRARLAMATALFGMNRGIPDGRFLAGAYWRRRGGLPRHFPEQADPARDNCGMQWVSPILPMRGADAMALHALVEPVFREHGFDLFLTFSMINERALGAVITVAYDKEDAEESARAGQCYRRVFELAMAAGYIPYRVGNQSMAHLDPHRDVYWKTVAKIKRALDPDGLIAPGRYEPARAAALSKRPT